MIATTEMTDEIIHHPVLGDARRHNLHPSDTVLGAIQPGDCVALLAPADGQHQIVARVERIERDEPAVEGPPNQRRPVIFIARIDKDESWGALFRPEDPAYQPGALVRVPGSAVMQVY